MAFSDRSGQSRYWTRADGDHDRGCQRYAGAACQRVPTAVSLWAEEGSSWGTEGRELGLDLCPESAAEYALRAYRRLRRRTDCRSSSRTTSSRMRRSAPPGRHWPPHISMTPRRAGQVFAACEVSGNTHQSTGQSLERPRHPSDRVERPWQRGGRRGQSVPRSCFHRPRAVGGATRKTMQAAELLLVVRGRSVEDAVINRSRKGRDSSTKLGHA